MVQFSALAHSASEMRCGYEFCQALGWLLGTELFQCCAWPEGKVRQSIGLSPPMFNLYARNRAACQ